MKTTPAVIHGDSGTLEMQGPVSRSVRNVRQLTTGRT